MKLEEELKMSGFKSPYHRAVLNIVFTSAWLRDNVASYLKPYGISEEQYNVLRILRGQNGKPLHLNSIQERMVHKSSNATRLVEKLRQKGFVERIQCDYNRRMVDITITESGMELLAELDKMENQPREVFESLSEDEATMLGDLLDKMRG